MVDSSLRPRPKSSTLFRTDANASTSHDSLQDSRRARSAHFLTRHASRQYLAAQHFPDAINFKRCNDDVPSPHREDNPVVDPVSGVLALGMDTQATPLRMSTWPRAKSARSPSSKSVRRPPQRAKSTVVVVASARVAGERRLAVAPARGWVTERGGSATPEIERSVSPDLELEEIGMQQARTQEEDGKAFRDALVAKALYRTSTQSAYDDVQWYKKLPARPSPPDHHESKPDTISTRLNIKRYASAPAGWQAVGRVWDYVQARDGHHIRGPQAVVFHSSHKKDKIPNYYGHLPDQETAENSEIPMGRYTQIYHLKPRPTKTACKQNIPGYCGHVHWTAKHVTNSDLGSPLKTTTGRIHRPIPLEEEQSPFSRTGILSKMVTLTHPYNPFNKVY
ncbi:protein SPMIP7-like [Corticium candelabrum]|uniref:protein SPMIP7-like n=1 Tax=Corticium candelabrum TaxID=121492 RepID=UPI002E25CCE4|nr:protein SPMIP7-like [Corticium candelabrum]